MIISILLLISKSNYLISNLTCLMTHHLLWNCLLLFFHLIHAFLFVDEVIDVYLIISCLLYFFVIGFSSCQHFCWYWIVETMWSMMEVFSSFLVDVRKNISCAFSFYHFLQRLDIVSFMLFTVISIVTFFIFLLYIFVSPHNLTWISKSWWSAFFYLLFLWIFYISIDNFSVVFIFILVVGGIRSFDSLFIKYSMCFLLRKK